MSKSGNENFYILIGRFCQIFSSCCRCRRCTNSLPSSSLFSSRRRPSFFFFPQAEMRSHFNPLPIIQSLLLLLLPLKSITIFWKVHSIETYRQEGKAWLRAAVVGVISISVAASSSRPAEKLSSTTPFSSSIYYYYILPFYALALAKIEPEGEDEARQPQE